MKKITIFSFLLSTAAISLNGLTLSGSAATGVTNLVGGNSTFVIVDTAGDGLDFGITNVGANLVAGASFGDDYIAAYNSVAVSFGTTVPGNAIFNLGTGGTAAGQQFYVVAFGTQSGDNITVTASDTFGVLAGSNWQLDANNSGTYSYGVELVAFPTVNGAEFTVVPEPSTYAALAGLLALGYVMVRRRS
tara:strand:- start:151 stop:720 length:570 start_codon:yes stop_codon:yes gene_type:complete